MSKPAKSRARPTGYSLGAGSDIDDLLKKLDETKALINNIAAEPGTDDALNAGYDPSVPDKISTLAAECQALGVRAQACDTSIKNSIQALKDYEEAIAGTQYEAVDNFNSRRKAAMQVVAFLVQTPANFHSFLRNLGIPMTEDIRQSIEQAAADASASQTDRWIQEANQSEEVVNLRDQLNKTREELKTALKSVESQSALAHELTTHRNRLQAELRGEQTKVTIGMLSTGRAKAEARKHNEKVLELQDDVAKLNIDMSLLRDQLSQEQEERRMDVSKHMIAADALQKQIVDLYEAKTSAELKNTELNAKIQGIVNQSKLQMDQARETARVELREIQTRLHSANLNLVESRGSLSACRSELRKYKEDSRLAKEAFFEQEEGMNSLKADMRKLRDDNRRLQAELVVRADSAAASDQAILARDARIGRRDQKIQRLKSRLSQQDKHIVELEKIVEGQVKNAQELLEHLSADPGSWGIERSG